MYITLISGKTYNLGIFDNLSNVDGTNSVKIGYGRINFKEFIFPFLDNSLDYLFFTSSADPTSFLYINKKDIASFSTGN